MLRHDSAADGLTSRDVMGIYTDPRGDLWLVGDGLFRFNGATFGRVL